MIRRAIEATWVYFSLSQEGNLEIRPCNSTQHSTNYCWNTCTAHAGYLQAPTGSVSLVLVVCVTLYSLTAPKWKTHNNCHYVETLECIATVIGKNGDIKTRLQARQNSVMSPKIISSCACSLAMHLRSGKPNDTHQISAIRTPRSNCNIRTSTCFQESAGH